MEKLIEAIARAMFASDYRDLAAEWENLPDDVEEGKPEYYLLARAALQAIEESGYILEERLCVDMDSRQTE